jgi:hypothetical protein
MVKLLEFWLPIVFRIVWKHKNHMCSFFLKAIFIISCLLDVISIL